MCRFSLPKINEADRAAVDAAQAVVDADRRQRNADRLRPLSRAQVTALREQLAAERREQESPSLSVAGSLVTDSQVSVWRAQIAAARHDRQMDLLVAQLQAASPRPTAD
jgi:hypothetical protein